MQVLMLTPDCQRIGRRVLQEARTLTRAGHAVTLLAGFECDQEEEYQLDGIHVRRLRYDCDDERLKKLRRYLPAPGRVKRVLNRALLFLARHLLPVPPFERFILEQGLRHPADVVHAHGLPALHAGVLLARARGVPLVYDAHDVDYGQDALPPRSRWAHLRKERRFIPGADVVLTGNDFRARLLRERYHLAEVHVLLSCADPGPTFDPVRARQTSPLRARIPGPGPILLFQGRLSQDRNLDTLVKAVAHVPPPARLAVLGYGACAGHLRRLVQDLSLGGRVHFQGPVPGDAVLDWTAGADLGLIPYLPLDEDQRYSSPDPFFEHVQAGVPVLAHELPFFQQMAGRHGVVACTDYVSPASLGRAITALLQGGALEGMRQRCLEARQILAWPVEGEKLLALYGRLVGGRWPVAA